MPELPEVEVVRRGLAPHVLGRRIDRVEVLDARSLRRQPGGPDRFVAALEGAQVRDLQRRGKFLWWRLADASGQELGEALMTHLGMSGQLRVRTDAQAAASPHRRVTVHLDDGTVVDFVDQRIFGGLWLSPLEETADGLPAVVGARDALAPADVRHIARDLLDPALDLDGAARALRSRRAPVKTLLLQQGIISGIGNIYADEGLWEARTRFDTPGQALSQRRALAVLRGAADVMERALAVGGTSFDALYVNVDGRSGYFARSLAVYGRTGQPCPRCGTPIRREVLGGRSSHYCPRCQRRL